MSGRKKQGEPPDDIQVGLACFGIMLSPDMKRLETTFAVNGRPRKKKTPPKQSP